MQIQTYLCIRALLSYFQCRERTRCAFLCDARLVLFCAVPNLWAIWYSLATAGFLQVVRLEPHHYQEHLPKWIRLLDFPAMFVVIVWVFHGIVYAYLRLALAQDTPRDDSDFPTGIWGLSKYIINSHGQRCLDLIHVVSCMCLYAVVYAAGAGLLFSFTAGTSVCDLCLIVTALTFLVPNALVAVDLLHPPTGLLSDVAVATAAEAAALGPQLCVIWSIVDVHDNGGMAQKMLCILTTCAYVFHIIAYGLQPTHKEGLPMNPSTSPIILSMCASFSASILVSVTVNITGVGLLNIMVLDAFLAATLSMQEASECIVDVFDPIMVIAAEQGSSWNPFGASSFSSPRSSSSSPSEKSRPLLKTLVAATLVFAVWYNGILGDCDDGDFNEQQQAKMHSEMKEVRWWSRGNRLHREWLLDELPNLTRHERTLFRVYHGIMRRSHGYGHDNGDVGDPNEYGWQDRHGWHYLYDEYEKSAEKDARGRSTRSQDSRRLEASGRREHHCRDDRRRRLEEYERNEVASKRGVDVDYAENNDYERLDLELQGGDASSRRSDHHGRQDPDSL